MTPELQPVPGETMDQIQRAARAWRGDWNRPSSVDAFNQEIWNDRAESGSPWGDESVRLVVRTSEFDLAVVDQADVGRLFSDRESGISAEYGDEAAARKHTHAFVAWPTENFELMQLMGEPPVDGYFVVQTVLAIDDRLVPIRAEWCGRQLSEQEAERMVRDVLGAISAIRVKTKVPAPAIPPDVRSAMDLARTGRMERSQRGQFTELLTGLEPVLFLEAIDALIPWMRGPLEKAPLAWMDKDDELADHAWKIVSENPKLRGSIRLAPWKTALGNPVQSTLRVAYWADGRRKSLELQRNLDGTY